MPHKSSYQLNTPSPEEVERFENALEMLKSSGESPKGIGTMGEKTLHRVIKNYIEPKGYSQEQRIGAFTADIVGENGIIEIQTARFEALRKKLDVFLNVCDTTIVYPIPHIKTISTIDTETGEQISVRRSPKKGDVYDVFKELYKIKPYLGHKNLRFRIIMLDINEYRIPPIIVKGRRNRKGYSLYDKLPTRLVGELFINAPSDWGEFIPSELDMPFTSADFSRLAGINLAKAQITLNILSGLKVIEKTGKKGRSFLYKI